MTEAEFSGSHRTPSEVAPARRLKRIGGVATVIRLSYFAWVPTVVSIGLGVWFLVSHEPVWFVLSTLVGLGAGLGWAIWFNVDR